MQTNGPAYSLETPPAHFDIGYLRWAWAEIASDFDWRNHLGKFITDYRESWDSLAADIPGWIEARERDRLDFEQEEADALAEREAQQQREADALAREEKRKQDLAEADELLNAGLTPHQWAWRNGVCADLNRDARFLGGIHRDVEITASTWRAQRWYSHAGQQPRPSVGPSAQTASSPKSWRLSTSTCPTRQT